MFGPRNKGLVNDIQPAATISNDNNHQKCEYFDSFR